MARIRSLKPDLWQDEAIGALSRDARLLFVGLITQADDDGRLVGATRLLWAQIYPWDDPDSTLMEQWLRELADANLIRRYESRGGSYIYLPGWKNHQKISHPKKSKLPSPPRTNKKPREASVKPPENSGKPPEASSLIGREGIGRDRNSPHSPPGGGTVKEFAHGG